MTRQPTTTTAPIILHVHGDPAPQGSKSFKGFDNNGHALMSESSRALGPWRDRIIAVAALEMLNARRPPLDEPVIVVITFLMRKGASLPAWKWLPDVRPDLDKLLRAVFDGLEQGGVLRDDSRIVLTAVGKRYALDEPPGVEIVVTPVGATARARQPIEAMLTLSDPRMTSAHADQSGLF